MCIGVSDDGAMVVYLLRALGEGRERHYIADVQPSCGVVVILDRDSNVDSCCAVGNVWVGFL